MKKLSISNIFRLIGINVFLTVFILCISVFAITKSVTGVFICLITTIILSVWGFVLIKVLQDHIVLFTNNVCQTIDKMMEGSSNTRVIFDNDTLLDRISHQLSRLYQMLQANKNAVKEQQANLQSLISDISHQVKTPATNLKMAVATLLEEELPRTTQIEYLQSINVQLDKLDFLINSMIKSSRLETGVIILEKRPSSIYETLAAALGDIFIKAEEKHLQVTINCPDDLVIPHDPKWTSEALFNILENAVKYTPAKGAIKVTVIKWEAYTKIDIADTGRGIPESHQAAIFKRFYREPEVHSIDGIGIGLYLTREIISKQGGCVKVTSAAGKGAVFSVFLPNN